MKDIAVNSGAARKQMTEVVVVQYKLVSLIASPRK